MTTLVLTRKTLQLTAMAVPLAGWNLHTTVLHRRLTQARRDPLTTTWRREAFTTRAQRLLEHHADDVVLVLADADHFKHQRPPRARGRGHRARRDRRPPERVGRAAWRCRPSRRRRVRSPRPYRTPPPGAAPGALGPSHDPPRPHEDGLLPLSVSLGAATPAAVAGRDLPTLMRAADAAMYEGKHTGDILRARPDHARVPSVNGRRAGRPGTAVRGRAA